MVFQKVQISIRNSLSEVKIQKEFDENIARNIDGQDLLSFGTTINLSHEADSFTEQEPLSVQFEFQKQYVHLLDLTCFEQVTHTAPKCICIDWNLDIVPSLITSVMKPQAVFRGADEPPTTLEALLQAYVEEEQLTGTNQWR
jgi:hypothetical protein